VIAAPGRGRDLPPRRLVGRAARHRRAGDARLFAEEAVAAGVDTVSVFRGDGTTMQAAAALVSGEIALGIIPGGTGNLLAGNLRIPRIRCARRPLLCSGGPGRSISAGSSGPMASTTSPWHAAPATTPG
jgi:diacylglycerol kinase family enzyme